MTRTTLRSPWAAVGAAAVGLAGLAAAAGGCAGAPAADPRPASRDVVTVPAASFPLDPAPERGLDPESPVTHVGRTVLPRCHKMVVAEVVSVTPAGPGVEIARVREIEVLWGPAEPDERPFAVVCGAVGLAPPPGRRALFLLRLLRSGDYEAIEVGEVDEGAGPARLATFRRVLEIESLPDAAARHAALREHLRAALASSDVWTRSNAVREYAAYAEAFPRGLAPEDGAALARALPGLREQELRRLAQSALDRAPAAAPDRPSSRAAAGARPPAGLAAFMKRFDEAASDAGARRKAVLEAAAELDRGAEPLVARALDDRDAAVREAAAAAAGEVGLEPLVPRLLTAAATDVSAAVRATSVTSLGHLRARSAVPTLAGLAAAPGPSADGALYALARIRDDAALGRLRELRGPAGTERARLVDFLLSEDFVRQERAMGARWAR